MQYMLLFYQDPADLAKRDDPAQAPAYWGAWMAYVGAIRESGVVLNGHGLMPPATRHQIPESFPPPILFLTHLNIGTAPQCLKPAGCANFHRYPALDCRNNRTCQTLSKGSLKRENPA